MDPRFGYPGHVPRHPGMPPNYPMQVTLTGRDVTGNVFHVCVAVTELFNLNFVSSCFCTKSSDASSAAFAT